MNQFKHLDNLFPTGADRLSGEVVSVSVTVQFCDAMWSYSFSTSYSDPVLFAKRKAWYVNASVNAFHLHRHLCKEFRDCPKPANMIIPEKHVRAVKRLLAAATMNSYLANYREGDQSLSYLLTVDRCVDYSPSLFWVTGEDSYSEIFTSLTNDRIPRVKKVDGKCVTQVIALTDHMIDIYGPDQIKAGLSD